MTLPWNWWNAAFDAIMGMLFSIIGSQAFGLAGHNILTPDFEFAACVAALIVLLFILFKLNFGNKVVMRFDSILDKYFYAGASKEETFHEILKNRMGYGVLDGCYKELRSVEKLTERCIEEEKELAEIKQNALDGKCTVNQLNEYQGRVDVILGHQQVALNETRVLLKRMDEIVKVSSSYKDVPGMKRVFDSNQQCHEKVKEVCEQAGEVSRLLFQIEKRIYKDVIAALEEVKCKKEEENSSDNNA